MICLQSITEAVHTYAKDHQHDVVELLRLLRLLEVLHREVRETAFQESLPRNRQALYTLLREIETEGGWPHIPRMTLRDVMSQLRAELAQLEDPSEAANLEETPAADDSSI